ncbi:MAG: hypothetical protein ACUVX8_10635 [Candidatus Zipacnadales bacterium]
MTVSRPLLIVIVIAILMAGAAIIYNLHGARQENPQGTGDAVYTVPPLPDRIGPDGRRILGNIEIEGPSLVLRDAQGREKWSARAEGHFKVDDAAKRVTATDVLWNLASEGEEVTIKSDRLEFSWAGGDLTIEGGIAIQAGPDRHFTARNARFESSTTKIICEGGVAWKLGRYEASAERLVVDVKNKKVRLRGNVLLRARRA